jgi:hypothetical protein
MAQETTVHEDRRQVIVLEPQERAMILLEMRHFLRGIEQIARALAQPDMGSIATTARSLGRQATHQVPPAVRQKLPQEFRALGFSVHSDFDQIALDAESMGDPKHTLVQLADTLAKCNACHESYSVGRPSR